MRAALLWMGVLLVAGGPLLPALVGGQTVAVQLFDLGRRGAETRRNPDEVALSAPAPLSAKRLSPSIVELSGPPGSREALGEIAARLAAGADAPALCTRTDESCLRARVMAQPILNRAAGPLDGAVVAERPPARALGLLGMMVALIGFGFVVFALIARRPSPRGELTTWILAGALGGAVGGGVIGAVLSNGHHQAVLVRPAHAPPIPGEPAPKERLIATLDVTARLASPGFSEGIPVDAKVTPSGDCVLVHVQSASTEALARWLDRLEQRVVAPERVQAASLVEELEQGSAVLDAERRAAWEAAHKQLEPPDMVAGPIESEPRSPARTAFAGAVSGAALGFALRARGRARS